MIPDNPNVLPAGMSSATDLVDQEYLQGQQSAAFEAARDHGMFDSEDTLLDCCAAAIDLRKNTIRTGAEEMRSVFSDFNRIFGAPRC